MTEHPIRLILADLRSTANVGSLLRTADATGVELVYAAGYTPYPRLAADERPPHVIHANTKAIAKTALGAEQTMPLMYVPTAAAAIADARTAGCAIIILEQAKNSLRLNLFQPAGPLALLVGSEVEGVAPDVLTQADVVLEIPMLGHKESYGVAVAGGIALHHLRYGVEMVS